MIVQLKFGVKEDEVGSVDLILDFSIEIRSRLDLSSTGDIRNRRSVRFGDRSYRLG